jgi:hypothetical protein
MALNLCGICGKGGKLGGQPCWRMSAEVWRRARLGASSRIVAVGVAGRGCDGAAGGGGRLKFEFGDVMRELERFVPL